MSRKTFRQTELSEENFKFNPSNNRPPFNNMSFGVKKRSGGFQESEETNQVFNKDINMQNIVGHLDKDSKLIKLKQIGQ